jgi:hypothetical protein
MWVEASRRDIVPPAVEFVEASFAALRTVLRRPTRSSSPTASSFDFEGRFRSTDDGGRTLAVTRVLRRRTSKSAERAGRGWRRGDEGSWLAAAPAYTRTMRRWVCIVALLAGFSGSGYAWTARPRLPVPIVRQLEHGGRHGLVQAGGWWLAS